MTLTGSSGLFESSLGDTYPRKSDYEYVKKKAEGTFYNPAMASKELVDEVFEIVNNRHKAIRMVVMAKSALRHNLRDEITAIQQPVCLIWGKNDTITPPFVGEEFEKLLPNAELNLLDECGHAPMMEQPKVFNSILEQFLTKL
jgi:pimeloyl-ACP methyl ester carboxylesterase